MRTELRLDWLPNHPDVLTLTMEGFAPDGAPFTYTVVSDIPDAEGYAKMILAVSKQAKKQLRRQRR